MSEWSDFLLYYGTGIVSNKTIGGQILLTEMVESGTISALRLSTLVTFTCAEKDGSGGGVAETEGTQARREEELAMATVPPDGCRDWGSRWGHQWWGWWWSWWACNRSTPLGFITLHGSWPSLGWYPPPSLLMMMDSVWKSGLVFWCQRALTITVTGLPFPQKSKDRTGPQKDRRPQFFAVFRPVSVFIGFNRFMTGL